MTPESLVSMRKSAALAFAIPGLEIDVRAHGRLVARVQRRPEAPQLHPSVTVLAPCAFRAAVSRVVATGSAGRMRFLGLAPDAELRLDPFMPFSGAANPIGLVVARVDQIFVHAFATVAPEATVHAAIAAADARSGLAGQIGASWDPATRIHLVAAESRVGDMVGKPAIRELMESLLITLAVAEIEHAVGASGHPHGTA